MGKRHVQWWVVHSVWNLIIICRNIEFWLVLIATPTLETLHQPWGDTAWPRAPFCCFFSGTGFFLDSEWCYPGIDLHILIPNGYSWWCKRLPWNLVCHSPSLLQVYFIASSRPSSLARHRPHQEGNDGRPPAQLRRRKKNRAFNYIYMDVKSANIVSSRVVW